MQKNRLTDMLTRSQITLENIRLYAFHGVLPQERTVGGWFTLNVIIDVPLDDAVITDDVADTINYATVLDIVKQQMSVPSNLLEHVAGRIAQQLFLSFPAIDYVDVTVRKDNPPMSANCDGASVHLCFSNDKSNTK